METDIVMGLELGANDYITKPFSLMVLRARVAVQLRNEKSIKEYLYKTYEFYFDFKKMNFEVGGSTIELSKTEQKQIKRMLVAEGCIYLLGSFLIAIIIIYTSSEKILASTVGLAWYFHLKITIVPCILILPILLLVAYFVPVYNYKKMNKESIVERI